MNKLNEILLDKIIKKIMLIKSHSYKIIIIFLYYTNFIKHKIY